VLDALRICESGKSQKRRRVHTNMTYIGQNLAGLGLELHLLAEKAMRRVRSMAPDQLPEDAQKTYSAAVCESSDLFEMLSLRDLDRATGASPLLDEVIADATMTRRERRKNKEKKN
jgi:hypothetical protein